jgi:hypothetical protein
LRTLSIPLISRRPISLGPPVLFYFIPYFQISELRGNFRQDSRGYLEMEDRPRSFLLVAGYLALVSARAYRDADRC